MTTENNKKIIYIESPLAPLREVPYNEVKSKLINPITGEKYKGVILEGIFADLNDKANNNNRIYDIPEYLEHLEKLKQQIHSEKGVYGECEHPSRYSIDFNQVSHKLLDVWYDPQSKLVYGRLMLLNNEKGKQLRQIVESGGCLAISARAAGEANEMPDGTIKATVQLLVTYDIVYHPGFGNAILKFKELNESYLYGTYGNSPNHSSHYNASLLEAYDIDLNPNQGFSLILYPDSLQNISESYEEYTQTPAYQSKGFLHSLAEKQVSQQSKNKEQKEQEILEDNAPVDKDEQERELSNSVQKLYEKQYFEHILDSIQIN